MSGPWSADPPTAQSGTGRPVTPGLTSDVNSAANQALFQELIQVLQSLTVATKNNAAATGASSGDLLGLYPGPISVVSTHLLSPLPTAQGGTGNTTGQPQGAASGDLGGTYPSPTVIQTHLLGPLPLGQGGTGNALGQPSGPALGDLGGFFPAPTVVQTHLAAPLPIAQGGTGNNTGAPSGVAGGDLSNNYPNPTVARINGSALGSTTPTAGQILVGSGAQWATQPVSGDATLSSVGLLTIANNAITTIKVLNAAITYAKIQNVAATSLVGNATGAPAAATDISLGATLAFSGTQLQTTAHTGDATSAANSNALAVGAISGQTVTPNTWTPVDGSGASLVFTAVSANYTRLGNMVFAYGTVTYPATASGANAIIGGLPFTVANAQYSQGPFVIRNNGGTFASIGAPISNTNTFNLQNAATSAQLTNANLSGLIVRWMAIYPVA